MVRNAQGSGKSLSMVDYAGKVILEPGKERGANDRSMGEGWRAYLAPRDR